MSSDKRLISDCAEYFKSRPGFSRAFGLMRKKWRIYGKASGSVEISKPSADERESLGRFLGRDFYEGSLRFTLRLFEEALKKTKFRELSLETLLSGYFGEKLITNSIEREKQSRELEGFFTGLLAMSEREYSIESRAYMWLKAVSDKKYGYSLICREYKKSPVHGREQVMTVCAALEWLKDHKSLRLAVLAAAVTKNPHALDRDTAEGKLLLHALSCIYGGMIFTNAEEKLMLYYTAGIIPDDLSSFTVAFGLRLYNADGLHPAYEGFIKLGEPYAVTLKNLSVITRAEAPAKKVYAVENQMVFSQLCQEAAGRGLSMVCTSGRMKTASWMLLDLLVQSGCRIYYSGDFDPEGLEIAEKLLYRYPGNAEPWRMRAEDYREALSDKMLSDQRIGALDKISHPALQEAKAELIKKRAAGYQEQLLDKLRSDILRISQSELSRSSEKRIKNYE